MRRPLLALVSLCALALPAAGCGSDDKAKGGDQASTPAATATPTATAPAAAAPAPAATKPKVKVPKGPPPKKLVVRDLKPGSGPGAKAGDNLNVHYVGVNYANGKQFDASWDRGQPFPLQLGAGMVIPGWDQGLVGIKPGGQRELVIPPDLAYGAQGSPPDIPPNATLVFVIDRLS